MDVKQETLQWKWSQGVIDNAFFNYLFINVALNLEIFKTQIFRDTKYFIVYNYMHTCVHIKRERGEKGGEGGN